jgi:tRNA (guanine37-N1)-methyltransferase
MKISVLTLFPELYTPFLTTSLIRRAQDSGLIECDVASMLDIAAPKERIDGTTFGHGPGMLIRPEIVQKGIDQLESKHGKAFKIFFSPHGKKLDQPALQKLHHDIMQEGGHCALIPARYEGMDARVEEYYADAVISVGDFVLMGGDLPAMVLLEGLLRYVPGVVGQKESVEQESFTGPFVDYPHYTAPVEWEGLKVPDVVRSGDHAALARWREEQAVQRTVIHHFDWVRSYPLNDSQKKLVRTHMPAHYAALMHSGIVQVDNTEGTSSVTSIDIHDVARSAKTFGLKQYFVVTPLEDQQKIVQKLLDFWQEGRGVTYRECRHRAIKDVEHAVDLDVVIDRIEQQEGLRPIIIGTSARVVDAKKNITYYDQERVWEQGRPVLILFGTGNGLSPSVIERCDYVLLPIEGFSSFNHLSVRSAAAIVLDRWLASNIKYR